MEPVSLTAQWTAAVRALESERPEHRLFVDPFARELARPDGFDLLERYAGAGIRDFIAIRTRYIDDALSDALSLEEIRQIVILAAGMDSRAYRLQWLDGTTVYEVDHQALMEEKKRRLSAIGAYPAARRIEVSADLAGSWLPALRQSGFNQGDKTLWVVEGLLFFLTRSQVRSLLVTLRDASATGSWLVTDMASKALLESPASQLFLAKLRKDGIPWLFGEDDPEEFLRACGWTLRDLKEPGNPGAGEGRWPYATPPRSVKGVPRSWLIQAERR